MATTYEGVTYNYTIKSGTETDVIITGTTSGTALNGSIMIPSTFTVSGTTYTVKEIGENAFRDTLITSVTIPASVTSIGTAAFDRCFSLTSLTFDDIQNSVLATIDVAAFQSAPINTSIAIPASVISIGYAAFNQCTQIPSITFAANSLLETIGDYAFTATAITSIIIPASVTAIGATVFQQTALTSITIPASVTSIGYHAFWMAASLTTVTFATGSTLATIGNGAFQDSGLTSIEIPASVTAIGNNAFYSATSLDTVTFATGSTLATIGNGAFRQTVIRSIEIPASVTSIGDIAFYMCASLDTVTFATGSTLATIGSSAFQQSGLTSIEIPASVISIGVAAFYTTSLTSVTFATNSTLATIGAQAFQYVAITSIAIPASVTSIGYQAFYLCASLATVTFAPGSLLKTIQGEAFRGTAITSIAFGALVTSIASDTFRECNSLATVSLWSSTANATGVAFGADQSLFGSPATTDWTRLGTTINGVGVFTADDWTEAGSPAEFTIDGFSSIGDRALRGNTWTVTHVVIGVSVDSIGVYAFSGCQGLKIVYIPPSVTSIGEYAFLSCTQLRSVTIPGLVASISVYTFYGCVKLASVAMSAAVTSIGEMAFANCGFVSVTIPEAITSIGDSAFYFCRKLVSVTIPKSVISIGAGAFLDCPLLATVSLWSTTAEATGVTFGADQSFFQSPATTDWVSLGTNINGAGVFTVDDWTGAGSPTQFAITGFTSIGASALLGKTTVTYVSIGASVTSIGSGAFANNSNLGAVRIETGSQLGSIQSDAFTATGLTTVYMGNTLVPELDAFSHVPGPFYGATNVTIIRPNPYADRGGIITFYTTSGETLTNATAYIRASGSTSAMIIGYGAIGDSAFENATGLLNVTIGPNVHTIGVRAFAGCIGLVSIHIPTTINIIGSYAFYRSGLTAANIPESIQTISSNAFASCSRLTSVFFDGVSLCTIIGSSAFDGANLTTPLSLPPSIVTIGARAFANNANLTTVNISSTSRIEHFESDAFVGCSGMTVHTHNIHTSDGLVTSSPSVGSVAFYGATTVTILQIPVEFRGTGVLGGVAASLLYTGATNVSVIGYTSIGNNAFYEATTVVSVNLSDSITTIGQASFAYSRQLTSVNTSIYSQLHTIGSTAFYGAISLVSFRLPPRVTSIEQNAFLNSGLSTLSMYLVTLTALELTPGPGQLVRGKEQVEVVILANIINSGTLVGDDVMIFEGPGTLDNAASQMLVADSVSSVIIKGYSHIADYAFYGATQLKTINLDDSVISIGQNAFLNSGLTTVYVNITNGIQLRSPSTPTGTVLFYGASNISIYRNPPPIPPPPLPPSADVNMDLYTLQGGRTYRCVDRFIFDDGGAGAIARKEEVLRHTEHNVSVTKAQNYVNMVTGRGMFKNTPFASQTTYSNPNSHNLIRVNADNEIINTVYPVLLPDTQTHVPSIEQPIGGNAFIPHPMNTATGSATTHILKTTKGVDRTTVVIPFRSSIDPSQSATTVSRPSPAVVGSAQTGPPPSTVVVGGTLLANRVFDPSVSIASQVQLTYRIREPVFVDNFTANVFDIVSVNEFSPTEVAAAEGAAYRIAYPNMSSWDIQQLTQSYMFNPLFAAREYGPFVRSAVYVDPVKGFIDGNVGGTFGDKTYRFVDFTDLFTSTS